MTNDPLDFLPFTQWTPDDKIRVANELLADPWLLRSRPTLTSTTNPGPMPLRQARFLARALANSP